MPTLHEILLKAKQTHKAIGHFNIPESVVFHAVVEAARTLNCPVLVGTSEGETDFFNLPIAVALVHGFRASTGLPVFLNADHHKSFERVKAAIDAGYDSVHFDGSALAYEDNVRLTKQCVAYARAKNPEISVEGELGFIETESSKIYEGTIEVKPEHLTKPEQARDFVQKTGIDRLAAVIGNIHGIATAGNPHLDIERLKQINAALPENVTLTLHGGSGIPEAEIKAALPHGLSNIHVSTEVRVAFHAALKDFLAAHPQETTPYKYLEPAFEAAEKLVLEKLKLFGN